jgi:RNA polymerase sigma factor for flagellar operon FliA
MKASRSMSPRRCVLILYSSANAAGMEGDNCAFDLWDREIRRRDFHFSLVFLTLQSKDADWAKCAGVCITDPRIRPPRTAGFTAKERSMDPKRKIARVLQWHKRRPSSLLRNEIIGHYLYLVDRQAERLHHRLPKSVELGDLKSDGFLGLLEAIDKFEPGRSQFPTFACTRILGSMLDGLRSRDPISRTTRRKVRDLETAAERIRIKTGVNPTPKELAREMGVSLKKCTEAASAARETVTRSLSGGRVRTGDEGNQISVDTLTDARQPDPAKLLAEKLLRKTIVSGLSRSERLITILYYYEGMTMKEIGATLDLSESRVSQMHTSIVARLRARFNPAQLVA